MQQTTTIQMIRGRRGMAAISTISLMVALVAIWAVERQDLPVAPAPVATRVQTMPFASPRFADEAAYVPTVQEYLNPALGEDYLPVAPAPEATRVQTAPFASPRFADEAAYVPTVQEYLNPALGEEYLPVAGVIAAPRSTPPISARILSEELASSPHSYQAIVAAFGEAADHSPSAGPR
jgi:hypothetical protein